MNFINLIEQITNEFVQCWNERNMEKMFTYLCPEVVVSSPYVQKILPHETSSVLVGKEKVMEYWRVFNADFYFKMDMQTIEKTNKNIYCLATIQNSPMKIYANFTMNEYGKFSKIEIDYK